MKKLNLAIVGCGNISGIYLQNLTTRYDHIRVYAVSDLDTDKAAYAAKTYGIEKILTLEEILTDPAVDIVLNISAPHGHYAICKQVLEAGKHVYVEKPLSITYAQGKELMDYANAHSLYVGCAPDTFMGAGISTCKQLIQDGVIGDVIGATAFMACHGHEHWHPNPEFYYQVGGGPMFDMGPYYLTALTEMMGNATAVMGMTAIGNPMRTVTSAPKNGKQIPVEVPTHVNGLIRFANGAIANIITSFDIWGSSLPMLEVHGTKGSLQCPDPNGFAGPVKVKVAGSDFADTPYVNCNTDNLRGIGLADMASAILEGKPDFAANGRRALHVLEIMEKLHVSDQSGKAEALDSRF